MHLSPKQALRAAKEIMTLGTIPPHLQHALQDEENVVTMLNETVKHGWRLNDRVSERKTQKPSLKIAR